jgi:CHAT domain-containing protein
MKQGLWKGIILLSLYCIAFPIVVHASPPDSLKLPASLIQQLKEYRQKDDLGAWIYDRIAFTDEDPAERVNFLMHTQKEAWRSYKTYEERLAWFDLLALQGYYQLQAGNILSSINAYETALQFYESYPLPGADIIEYVLKPLGNNYTRLSDYPTALYIHQKTLTLALNANDPHVIASVYSNMAICAKWKGDLLAAVEYCKKGIAQVNKKKALHGLLLSVYADVLIDQNKYDTAAIVCRQSLKQLQDASSVYWYTSALQTAARIALHQQKYEAATNDAQTALKLLQQQAPASKWREKAKVNVLLGDIYLHAGNAGQSLHYYQRALVLMLPSWKPAGLSATPPENLLYSENTISDALAGKAAALLALNKQDASLQQYMAAFRAERKLRKVFYSTESKLKELQATRLRADAAMRIAYQLWTITRNPKYKEQFLLIMELSKAQVLSDERNLRLARTNHSSSSDSLLKKVKQLQEAITYYQHELVNTANKKQISALLQATEYELSLINKKLNQQAAYASTDENMLTVERLYNCLKRIPENVLVLELFEGVDSSYLIECNEKGIQSIRLIPAGRQLHVTIQQFMQRWFGKGPSAMLNEPQPFYNACYELYRTIFSNYHWKPKQHYILIPDGIFSYLPFEALLTEPGYRQDYANWPWLFKKVSLSQAYSLQSWYEQQTTQYHSGPFTAFFIAKSKNNKQPTLAVEQEYNALKEKISGTYYVDSSATWSAFTQAAKHAGILHIGTHAVSSTSNTLPYLQLYDRPFYLFDLRYQKFTPSLIMLGACKTADGQLLVGEGVNSISRGFVAAGAGGVVSGLWNVNDETAIELSSLFYQQLQQGQDPARALYHAKQQWLQLHKDHPMLQLPYYWSGYMYSGHLQKIELTQKKAYWLYYLACMLLILTGVVCFIVKNKPINK